MRHARRCSDESRHAPPELPYGAARAMTMNIKEPQELAANTLTSSTTDRLASRRRCQAAPGSYLNWERLQVFGATSECPRPEAQLFVFHQFNAAWIGRQEFVWHVGIPSLGHQEG